MTAIKLNKEQIQKLVLSAIGFLILLYVYFTFFLGPLNRSRATTEHEIAEVQAKLANSKGDMARAAKLEAEASTATARYAALQALSPEGAPIAWFPPRMKAFFANQEIEKASAKLEGNAAAYKQPELESWSKYSWQIDLPQTDFMTAGKAIAALENSEPLLAIHRLSMKGGSEDPQFQQVVLSVTNSIMTR